MGVVASTGKNVTTGTGITSLALIQRLILENTESSLAVNIDDTKVLHQYLLRNK